MSPLLRLELRRQLPMAARMALLTIIVLGVFVAAGKRAPADLLAVVLGTGLGALLLVPMGISRDKMEGTLDFICGLPVEPRAIAMSRFAAMAIFAAPWAVAAGAVAFALPPETRVNPVAVAVLAWLVVTAVGACGVAALACFELETMLGAPLVVLVVVCVAVPRIVRRRFPAFTANAVVHFLQQPNAPVIVGLCLVATGAVVGAIAFGAATRGFANYRADPARR